MSAARIIFEAVPIFLAFVAIFTCGRGALLTNRRRERVVYIGMMFCSTILVIAQSSWSWSYLVNHDLIGTVIANNLWTLFNTATMSLFIFASWRKL